MGSFRPCLESLEDRLALATVSLPLDVTDVQLDPATGQLEAIVSLAGQATDTVPIDLTTTAAAPDAADDCPILNLHLGEINLNLLGLHVDTSEICLDVTATDNQGLLGSLLCDLSGGGLDLAGILGQLGGVVGQVDTLLSGIENVLNQALDQVLTVTDVFGGSAGAAGVAAQQTGDFCNILNLSLGPIDLDVPLLGVGVHLDNCADGPVTVDVTADPQGGLLGSLLCGIADGVDPAAVNTDQLIGQVNQLIDRLGVLANRLDQLPETTPDIRNMTRHLEKFADRADSLADVDRLLNQVDGLISRTDRVLARLA